MQRVDIVSILDSPYNELNWIETQSVSHWNSLLKTNNEHHYIVYKTPVKEKSVPN